MLLLLWLLYVWFSSIIVLFFKKDILFIKDNNFGVYCFCLGYILDWLVEGIYDVLKGYSYDFG